MTIENLYQLRFPIGTFHKPDDITAEQVNTWINRIEVFPQMLTEKISDLNPDQLQWKYRPDGWNVKQVIHHCADSHMNSLIRFKLALTEDQPTIRPYFEDRWAELADGTDDNIEHSVAILKGVHGKLAKLLRQIPDDRMTNSYIHPEHGKSFQINETIGIYAWHGQHHLAHIDQAIRYKGAFN